MHQAEMTPRAAKTRTWSETSSESTDSIRSGDSLCATPTSCKGALTLADLVGPEVDQHVRVNTPRTKKPPVTFADASTWPDGLTSSMMTALLRLAKDTNAKLVHEAQASLQTPMKRNDAKLHSFYNGIELYEIRSPVPPSTPLVSAPVESQTRRQESRPSLSRSLWNRLTLRRKRGVPMSMSMPTFYSASCDLEPTSSTSCDLQPPSSGYSASYDPQAVPTPQQPKSHPPPRLFGLTQVRIPLDELLDVVGHRSSHATTLLYPGMRQTGSSHALVDGTDHHVCLRSMSMPASIATGSAPRDFLVVEYHSAFETSTGRRGYAVVSHSVHWTRCPSPSEGTVRGSIYESGLVAIESATDPEKVVLYCVGEVNLKGSASEVENFKASHHRVTGTLKRIKQTVEERATMLRSLSVAPTQSRRRNRP